MRSPSPVKYHTGTVAGSAGPGPPPQPLPAAPAPAARAQRAQRQQTRRSGRLHKGPMASKLQSKRMETGRVAARFRRTCTAHVLAVKNYVDQVSLHGTKRVGTELAVEKRSKRTRVTQDQPLKVRVRRVARMGRGKYQCVTARSRLDIAFDPDQRQKVLSRKFDIAKQSIIRNQQLVAESLCMAQSAWLASLEALCQRYRPLAVCTSRKWDETAENSVRLATIAEVGQHLQVDTVEVLVSSIRAVVCWRENTGSALVLDINVPPCPLTTTSADCIHAALSRHPQVSPLWELTQRLLKLGKYCTHTPTNATAIRATTVCTSMA